MKEKLTKRKKKMNESNNCNSEGKADEKKKKQE